MSFLKLRTDHNRTRRDGDCYITPLIVDAPRGGAALAFTFVWDVH